MNVKQETKQSKGGRVFRILLSLVLVFGMFEHSAQATSTTKEQLDEAERRKQEKEGELAEAQQDLKQTQASLARLQQVKNGYQGEMNELNTELQLVADNLHQLEVQIDIKQIEIDETNLKLEQAKTTRQEQYESMKKRIRFLYENGGMGYVDILLSAESFSEFLNFADYIEDLSAYDRKMLDEYVQNEHDITEAEIQLEAEMDELEVLRADVEAQQNEVNALIQKTANNIAATADSIENVNAQADAYEQEVLQAQQEAGSSCCPGGIRRDQSAVRGRAPAGKTRETVGLAEYLRGNL